MSSLSSSLVFSTSENARDRIAFSFWLTSCSDQKKDCRSCTHSKYDTVTPPALARMSGTRKMPRSRKMASASGVVGPLAPSTISFALTSRALFLHALDGEAERVVDAAVVLADRDDRAACLFEQPRADAADVAEPLHRDACLVRKAVEMFERSHRADRHPAAGGLYATERPAHLDRLAGHRRRHRVAEVHGERVHDPRHSLPVGVDVGRRDVAVGADENRDLGREPAGHVLELVERKLFRVDDDAALGASEGDVHDRALPRHPHRQGLDLVQGDVWVVADAPLRRPAIDVVLHAIAREHAQVVVVHLDGEVAGELALDLAQHLAQPRLELDDLGRGVELRLGGAPFVGLDDRVQLCCAHINTDDRGYSAFGSQITLMQAGRPEAKARSRTGRIWSGRSTISPYPPSASTTLSYRVRSPRSAATLMPNMLSMGCFSSAQIPLLPTTHTTWIRWRTIVSNSIAEKPNAPSPDSRMTCRSGCASLAAMA